MLSFLKRMENVANFILSYTTTNCAFHRGPLLKGVSHLGSLEPVMDFEEVRDYRVGQVVLHSTQ